jgi:hypothetical protein
MKIGVVAATKLNVTNHTVIRLLGHNNTLLQVSQGLRALAWCCSDAGVSMIMRSEKKKARYMRPGNLTIQPEDYIE